MKMYIGLPLLLLGTLSLCPVQSEHGDGGLIVSYYYYYDDDAQISHFPGYPGYDDVPGELDPDSGIIEADVPKYSFSDPVSRVQSLAVDYRKKVLYMYDNGYSEIKMATGFDRNLSADTMQFYSLHTAVSKEEIKLAYDWLSHSIYWADPQYRWIVVAPGSVEKAEMGYHKIIVRSHLDVPNGIALDPIEGVLCWSDIGDHPKIECSDLLGRDRRTIASEYLRNPSGLAIDISDQRLYWLDDFSDTVLSCTYSGDDIRTVGRRSRSNFFEMDIYKDTLYVTDTYDDYVYSMDKYTGTEVENPISVYPYTSYGVAVSSEENQPIKETDHCESMNCDHICITERFGATCVCSEGYILDGSTGQCKEYETGYHKAVVFATEKQICVLDIRMFVEPSFVPKCIYKAPSENHKTSDPPPARRRRQDVTTPPAASSTVPVTHSPATTTSTTAAPTTKTTTAGAKTTSTTVKVPTTTSTIVKVPTTPTTTTTVKPTTSTTQVPTTPTVSPDEFITRFDMDMEKRILYFSTGDNSIYKRLIDSAIESDARELIVEANGKISGLAYDAEDPNNVYWCESDTGHVWVVNTMSKISKRLTKDNTTLINPKDIIVLLNQRRLAMVAGEEKNRTIITMSMDAKDRTVVLYGASEILGLIYDSEKQWFYYISDGYAYYVSLDGTKNEVVLYGVDDSAVKLLLYQHYIAPISDNGTHISSTTFDLHGRLVYDVFTFAEAPLVDIKILDPVLQSVEHISPCAKDNGGCSQICITKYENNAMTPVCECQLGYTIENSVNCTARLIELDVVISTDWTDEEVLLISLITDEIGVVPGEVLASYMGVYFDDDRKKVIYAEYYDSIIYSKNLNGTDRKVLVDLGWDSYAYRFDMDRTNGYIYFTGYASTVLGVFTPNGEYKILYDNFGWDSLNDIAVHPKYGWLYFCLYSWSGSYVGRGNMDGTGIEKLIVMEESQYPDGLAIDYLNDFLFWSDSSNDIIYQCNLDGLDCIEIVNMGGNGNKVLIRDIETDGVYLYFATNGLDHIVRVPLADPDNSEIIGKNYGLGKLDTIAISTTTNINVQPMFEGCRDRNGLGDCSTMCLPSSKGRRCACNGETLLKPDGRTCEDIYQCKGIFYQNMTLSSGKTDDIEVTMDKDCFRYLDDKCAYSCPTNFEPIFDTILTCTKAGWNLEPDTLCKEIRCPVEVDNGKLADTCQREVGEECDFECDDGFVKTTNMAVCKQNGSFHIQNHKLCKQYLCPEEISNGKLDQSCSRTIDSECSYTCDKYYSPNVKISKATCGITGWTMNLCQESTCADSSLQFGNVTADCNKKIGDTCSFGCNSGYVKSTAAVFCKGDKMWHPSESCTPYTCSDTFENGLLDQSCARTLGSSCSYTCNIYYTPSVTSQQATCTATGWDPASADLCEYVKCPLTIPNGKIKVVCERKIGSTCDYECDGGYEQSESHPNITCGDGGNWFTNQICQRPPGKKLELNETAAVVGFSILGVIVIILVVAVACMVRRKKSSKAYDNFDGSAYSGGSISMGNPGFMQDEHTYSNADTKQDAY